MELKSRRMNACEVPNTGRFCMGKSMIVVPSPWPRITTFKNIRLDRTIWAAVLAAKGLRVGN